MNMRDYFVNWDAHLTTFWVPIILGLIFLSLAIQSLVKDRNVRVCILYVFLLLCCVGYIGWGDSIISRLASLW